jgi:hypothetical protein
MDRGPEELGDDEGAELDCDTLPNPVIGATDPGPPPAGDTEGSAMSYNEFMSA